MKQKKLFPDEGGAPRGASLDETAGDAAADGEAKRSGDGDFDDREDDRGEAGAGLDPEDAGGFVPEDEDTNNDDAEREGEDTEGGEDTDDDESADADEPSTDRTRADATSAAPVGCPFHTPRAQAEGAEGDEVAAEAPSGAPKVPAPLQSMIAGAVLGGAIGDAMGHPTEFIGSVASIHSRFGPKGVTRFELYWDRDGKRFAPYTDDTQMAEIVLRTLVDSRAEDAGLDATMRRMAEGFIRWADRPQGGHRAPGNACLSGCRALARGVHWSEAGGPKAGGCGSVMRAYPFGLVFADDIKRAERWSVAHSKLTHRDPIALAACAAMAVGMARILRGEPVMTIASEMVAAACRYSAPTAAMMADAIDDAVSGVEPDVTLDRLRAWAAHEAIAAAVYIFVRHPDSPADAILEGANTPGDSDSIATLAGAMVGARCGVESLPAAWVRDVERSAELLELAVQVSLESAR